MTLEKAVKELYYYDEKFAEDIVGYLVIEGYYDSKSEEVEINDKLKSDCEKAVKAVCAWADEYPSDEDDGTISFYCSNDYGEGIVEFILSGDYWKEHWSRWENYDEEDDYKPESMRYESYLSKKDLKEWLSNDGFENISELGD